MACVARLFQTRRRPSGRARIAMFTPFIGLAWEDARYFVRLGGGFFFHVLSLVSFVNLN